MRILRAGIGGDAFPRGIALRQRSEAAVAPAVLGDEAIRPVLSRHRRGVAVDDIERGVTNFAQQSNGGLIVTANPSAIGHRKRIIDLAARHKLPAVYFEPLFAKNGGLVSYGPDIVDQYRRAAGYVDRILKGEKPADLPVQTPTKYNLVINLKTAKALNVALPQAMLASADEVIE